MNKKEWLENIESIPKKFEEVDKTLDEVKSSLDDKQSKADDNLKTKEKTVVGSINELNINFENYKKDYIVNNATGRTGGSSINYTLTLNPAPTAYKELMNVTIIPHTNSTGDPTLNINGLGSSTLLNQDGTAMSLKANIPYSFVRVGNSFFIASGGYRTGDYVQNTTFEKNIKQLGVFGGSGGDFYLAFYGDSMFLPNGRNSISRYDLLSDKIIWTISANSIRVIEADINGNIYYNDYNTLYKIDINGNKIWSTDMGMYPNVLCMNNGFIYVGQYSSGNLNYIKKYNSSTGGFICTLNIEEKLYNQINSIVKDDDGYIYICSHGYIIKFDSNDKKIWSASCPDCYQIKLSKTTGDLLLLQSGGKLYTIDKLNGSMTYLFNINGNYHFCEDDNGDLYTISGTSLIKHERKSGVVVWDIVPTPTTGTGIFTCEFNKGRIYTSNSQGTQSTEIKIKILN